VGLVCRCAVGIGVVLFVLSVVWGGSWGVLALRLWTGVRGAWLAGRVVVYFALIVVGACVFAVGHFGGGPGGWIWAGVGVGAELYFRWVRGVDLRSGWAGGAVRGCRFAAAGWWGGGDVGVGMLVRL